jgi:hypothetical protein
MNDTLIERLRYHTATLDRSLCMEAADRIEVLEAALREIASGYPSPADARLGRLMQIARAALDKEAGK